jgi:AbrB family looped-hinge helix DNA binding protein
MDGFKVSSKGQVTLPLRVRRFLRLEPGDQVRFEIKDGQVLLLAAPNQQEAAFKKFQDNYQKHLGENIDTNQSLKDHRDMRGWDEKDDEVFAAWEKEQAP